jgi:hypothetical protein
MSSDKYKFMLSSLAMTTFTGCSYGAQKVTDQDPPRFAISDDENARQVTNAAARELKAHSFVEIKFDPKSSRLNTAASNELETAVHQASQTGTLDEIMVLAWSDEDYPTNREGKLSNQQNKLAEMRYKAVKEYFSKLKGVSVDTYNMAERPHTLSKWFRTKDTRVKNALVSAGLRMNGENLTYPSKASHAVVLFKLE